MKSRSKQKRFVSVTFSLSGVWINKIWVEEELTLIFANMDNSSVKEKGILTISVQRNVHHSINRGKEEGARAFIFLSFLPKIVWAWAEFRF